MQGQGLRDRASEFETANIVVLGASFDTVEEQKAFAEKESLPFRLLADPDRSVGQDYGVARDEGHDFAGWPRRASFLIQPD